MPHHSGRQLENDRMTQPDPLANATLEEMETFAAGLLPTNALDDYASGARDEQTFRGNLAAWKRWWLVPRMLIDVSTVSTATSVLGEPISLPILIAPMASQGMAHPEGELATARAAAAAGTIMVVSTSTMVPIEDIGAVPDLRFWFQLYPFSDFEATVAMIQRAIAAGATAVCLTVDVASVFDPKRRPRGGVLTPDWVKYPMHPPIPETEPALTWAYIDRLRARIAVPIVLKGILHPDDARAGIDAGAAAIIVSNHGGRTLDGAIPTAEILPEVAEAVDGRVELLVDGGIRRGADVLRALALGARAVLVGRPFLWGLAINGDAGQGHVFALLRHELEEDARFCGIADVTAVPPGLVRLSKIGLG
jgi:4-hydroxymandelate oxidase